MPGSIVTFPFIRSNRIEFYFLRFRIATRPGAPSTWKRGKLACQPTGPAGLLTFRHAHSAPKVRNGNGITTTALRDGSADTVLRKRLRKRIRMNGNVTLETRRNSATERVSVCGTVAQFGTVCRQRYSIHSLAPLIPTITQVTFLSWSFQQLQKLYQIYVTRVIVILRYGLYYMLN